MHFKKIVIPVLTSTLMLSAMAPNILAAEDNTPVKNESVSFGNIPTPSMDELKKLELSDNEIQELLSVNSTGIYLIDGIAFDENGDQLLIKERGKLSWATKALRAAWDKLPTKVKNTIGGITGFETLLNFIDHYTGTIEDAVYDGCIYLGMSDTVAWWVTKTLTLLVL